MRVDIMEEKLGRIFWLLVIMICVSACRGPQPTVPEIGLRTQILETPLPSSTRLPRKLIPSLTLLPTITQFFPTETQTPTPAASGTPSIEKLRDLPYFADGHYKQILDIYLPTNPDGLFPTLMVIHGGGGDKSDFGSFAMRFVKQGNAVVSINYREMPEDKYPAAVEDAFCALAWMHTHAFEYNLDPDRFVVLGHSSGGTLAAMLGVVDNPEIFLEGCPHQIPDNDWIKGVITFTGIFDYPFAAAESGALTSYINAYLGIDQIADPDIWNEASPIAYVDGNEPPFLVIHGEADRNIDPRQSMEFVKALDVAGVRTQLLIIPDLDHPGIVWNEIALTEVEKFLAMLIDT